MFEIFVAIFYGATGGGISHLLTDRYTIPFMVRLVVGVIGAGLLFWIALRFHLLAIGNGLEFVEVIILTAGCLFAGLATCGFVAAFRRILQ